MTKKEKFLQIGNISGVIVCHSHKWVWPFVPRTASRCIREALKEAGCKFQLKGGLRGDGEFTEEDWEQVKDYFSFTFIRNPYDRVISWMGFFHVEQETFIEKNFQYFVEAHHEDTRLVAMHTLPSAFYTHLNGSQMVDFIGKYEFLHQDWRVLAEKIGIEPVTLPNKRKWQSKREPYLDCYGDPKFQQMVETMYSEDISLFRYELI